MDGLLAAIASTSTRPNASCKIAGTPPHHMCDYIIAMTVKADSRDERLRSLLELASVIGMTGRDFPANVQIDLRRIRP